MESRRKHADLQRASSYCALARNVGGSSAEYTGVHATFCPWKGGPRCGGLRKKDLARPATQRSCRLARHNRLERFKRDLYGIMLVWVAVKELI